MHEPKPHTAAILQGDILGGKYRVEHALGSGGMGMVFAARHVELGTKVAIKALLPEMLANAEAVARFAREAKTAAKISSEHVVRIFDVGSLESGAPYMVMELLEGQDCAAYLEQHGPLLPERAIALVSQACIAVADAHALGIVHRDLKPSNLFCTWRSDGQLLVKVLDFGISKGDAWGDAAGCDLSITQRSIALGCPPYISPEQWRSAKDVDGQTDIWALGVILYELLTGTVPFEGGNVREIAFKVATEAPPSIRQRRSDVPAELEQVILKCLAKEPRERFRDTRELAAALRACGCGQSTIPAEGAVPRVERLAASSAAPVAISARPDAAQEEVEPLIGRWWNEARRFKSAQAAGSLAVLVAMVWIGSLLHPTVSATPTLRQPNGAASNLALAARATNLPPDAAGVPALKVNGTDSAELIAPPAPAPEHVVAAAPRTNESARSRAPQNKATTDVARVANAHCDPPYFFDTRGNRVFKVDCL